MSHTRMSVTQKKKNHTLTETVIKISGLRALKHMLRKQCLHGQPLHCIVSGVTAWNTHSKGRSTWVSASVLMNLSPGGGAGVMSHTKSSCWATKPTRGQQINLHYISIPTIHLMREGLCVRVCVCECIGSHAIASLIKYDDSLLLIQCAQAEVDGVKHILTYICLLKTARTNILILSGAGKTRVTALASPFDTGIKN